MTRAKIRGLKERDRIREAIRAYRAGRVGPHSITPNILELLVLCRGAKNAVERNRIRRRVREAVRALLAKGAVRPGRAYVIEATRQILTREWKDLCREIRDKLTGGRSGLN